jgi:hypothetical protein
MTILGASTIAAIGATRHVNAYGQREEGPSRWQERKEAKRQMYLMSTERAVKLGVRKKPDPKSLGGCHMANEVGGGSHKVCGPIVGTFNSTNNLSFWVSLRIISCH